MIWETLLLIERKKEKLISCSSWKQLLATNKKIHQKDGEISDSLTLTFNKLFSYFLRIKITHIYNYSNSCITKYWIKIDFFWSSSDLTWAPTVQARQRLTFDIFYFKSKKQYKSEKVFKLGL